MKFQLSALVSLGAFLAVEAGVAGVSQSQSLSARDGVDLAIRSAAANMTWADLESGADAAAICGSLGVFELPEGSDPALVRLCSDHPSLGRPGSNANGVGTLACAKNQKGCDKGYCWKQCGENGAVTINGGFGKHVWATPNGLRVYFTGLFIAEYLYTISIVLVKAAILAFYWRILSARRESRLAIYILLGITCAWGMAVLLVSTFQCLPVSAFWLRFDANANLSPSDYECGVNVKTFFIANAIPNIITDVLLLLLPVPGIWTLQLRKPQKMALVGIFTLGIFVTAVSFIRLHYVLAIDFADPDTTWLLIEEMMWTGIEVNIGTVSGIVSAVFETNTQFGTSW
ncbi:hypothetical protein CGLO_00156 [Colletotrichum gloeosporioides Cg-14]|uniref:Rhodopsin domain-containing protein n=1 Tax=Colletotrichum gloeosporioides (strain Cg-14) TaxID=1237896 RepID=T0L4P5_COLGC|nr:hypothetical protein CGLO_00156 [Colletotrichum gloeosporioides Cg-14]